TTLSGAGKSPNSTLHCTLSKPAWKSRSRAEGTHGPSSSHSRLRLHHRGSTRVCRLGRPKIPGNAQTGARISPLPRQRKIAGCAKGLVLEGYGRGRRVE